MDAQWRAPRRAPSRGAIRFVFGFTDEVGAETSSSTASCLNHPFCSLWLYGHHALPGDNLFSSPSSTAARNETCLRVADLLARTLADLADQIFGPPNFCRLPTSNSGNNVVEGQATWTSPALHHALRKRVRALIKTERSEYFAAYDGAFEVAAPPSPGTRRMPCHNFGMVADGLPRRQSIAAQPDAA